MISCASYLKWDKWFASRYVYKCDIYCINMYHALLKTLSRFIFFIRLWLSSVIYGVLVVSTTLYGCPLPCRCNGDSNSSIYMECCITNSRHDVIFHNTSLPDHTVSVFISVSTYMNEIPDAAFQEPSWNQVLHLKLDGNGKITYWRPSIQTFQSLRCVQYLYLRGAGITYLENGSFSELPDLIVLDLSQNRGLHLIDLTNAMLGLSSPNLQMFNVSGVNSQEDMGLVTIDHPFMENLRGTRLTVLDISWTRTFAFAVPFIYYLPYLESLNASGTMLLGQSSCLSKMYVMDRLKELVLDNWPQFTRSRSVRRSVTNECIYANLSTNGDCFNCPPNLQTVSFINSTINISYIFERNGKLCINPNNSIRRINLSGVQLTASSLFPSITGVRHLEEFDISRTSLTDLHEDSFRYFQSLQILNMAGNSFYGVIPSTFSKLFFCNGNLSHLNISWNHINSLPSDFLITNSKITVLDLSQSFELIDLSYNRLVVFLPVFPEFISVDLPNLHGINIYIAGNSLQCTCSNKSLEMIIWMVASQSNNNAQLVPPKVTCIYEDSVVEILEEDVSVSSTVCSEIYANESSTYILSAVIGIVIASLVAVCLMFGIWCYRIKKCTTNNRIENQIHLKNNVGINIISDSQPDYAVFLSFSSNDKDFAIEYVWPKLETKLKCLLKKETKLVFVGDANFALGRQICEEVISATSRCWCTVLIISNKFLESDWCLFEVQSAWNSGCRIFPLFIEKCDGRKAKGIMKVVCRDMVRLLWPKGRADLQEKLFDSLCAEIVKHINLNKQSK
ncbi:hypothetical protein ACJMK2_026071 [Sinanodonta woodiana]|uniref:TIR domain-containing protein n=1 Tax=Sinanodonta woodiana TaxID=1069815 RepID=A0ABD3XM71_SINWO